VQQSVLDLGAALWRPLSAFPGGSMDKE
jgi:hypothetical protein